MHIDKDIAIHPKSFYWGIKWCESHKWDKATWADIIGTDGISERVSCDMVPFRAVGWTEESLWDNYFRKSHDYPRP